MENAIVAIIVACAALSVTWRYAPAAAKMKVRGILSRIALQLGWKELAGGIADDVQTGGCGSGCGSCGGCRTKNAPGTAAVSIKAETIRRTARH